MEEKSDLAGKHFQGSCLARGVREGLLDAGKASLGLGATGVIDQALYSRLLVRIWYVSTSAVILRSHPS
jgi:hypothetical protein